MALSLMSWIEGSCLAAGVQCCLPGRPRFEAEDSRLRFKVALQDKIAMVEVRGPCRPIYAIYWLSAYEKITKKRWIEQYGEYPISVKKVME